MSVSSPLPKWQIALVVGAPVAIGLSYMYYKNKNNNSKISDKRENRQTRSDRQDALANAKSLSIDDTSVTQFQVEAEIYKNEGNRQFKMGNYEEAIVEYKKAIEICPKKRNKDMAIFYQNKAAAHEQLKNYVVVKEDCTKALELDPKYTKALLRRARALEKLGELEPALDDVSTACIYENFANPASLILADKILEQLGKHHAVEDMKTRKFILPNKYFFKSYIEAFTKDPIFSKLKNIDAEDIPQFFKRPLVALKKEKYESIKSICTDIIESAEFSALPSSKLEIILLRATFDVFLGEHNSAFKDFAYILSNDESTKDMKVNALIKRATLHMQLNFPEMAYNDFDAAINMDQECADIYHHRGHLHLLENNLEAAKSDFEKAVNCNSSFASAFVKNLYIDYRLSIKQSNLNKVEQMIAEFQDCFERFPDYPESYLLYAQMMSDVGNHENANIYFTKALEKEPDNGNIYVHKGLLLLQTNPDIDITVEYIRKALKFDPKCELAYETLGSIEVQRGNLEEAVDLFDEALRLAHTFRQITHLYSLKDAAKTQLKIKTRLDKYKRKL